MGKRFYALGAMLGRAAIVMERLCGAPFTHDSTTTNSLRLHLYARRFSRLGPLCFMPPPGQRQLCREALSVQRLETAMRSLERLRKPRVGLTTRSIAVSRGLRGSAAGRTYQRIVKHATFTQGHGLSAQALSSRRA